MDYPTTGLCVLTRRMSIKEVLDGANASGLRALGALADLELDALVLFQGCGNPDPWISSSAQTRHRFPRRVR